MSELIFYIIVGFIVFQFILSRILSYLNLRNWSKDLPKELSEVYDAETYENSQNYYKESQKFILISSSVSFVLILTILFVDGFAVLDYWIRMNITEHAIWLPLIFFGILGFASDILSTPFAVYNTFVIEERYGFNKTTPKTFVTDKIKGWILSLILGGGLLAVIIWMYELFGTQFWIYTWIVITVFTLFMAAFYTSFILPIFNKLTPLEEGSLRNKITEYCKRVNFNITNLFVMDGSRRSSKANAFFSGIGPKKKTVLYDTLVENHSDDELVAVLAHEIGHFKKKHTLLSVLLSILNTGILLYILSLLIESPHLPGSLGSDQQGFHLSLLAFSLLFGPISLLTGIAMNYLSRKNEYEADDFARKTFSAQPLITALIKLSKNNLSNLNPHPLYVFINYSHPPLLERMKALNN